MVSSHGTCVTMFSTGAPGVPDLRSAADPGADRWFSMVTSTIDATVTLLKERILLFLTVQVTAPVE